MKFVAAFASSPTLARFCRTEFLAVARTLGVDVTPVTAPLTSPTRNGSGDDWLNSRCNDVEDPFFVFESHASLAAVEAVAARCVLLRNVHILMQAAPTLAALYAWRNAQIAEHASSPLSSSPTPETAIVVGEEEKKCADDHYAYHVETIGKRYPEADKKAILEFILSTSPTLAGVPMSWQNPRRRFFVLIEHETEMAPQGARGFEPSGAVRRVLHVMHLVTGGRTAILAQYDLKRRPYIGTTSMPPEESILMANFAAITPGSLVYDPFCGTGSLLVAAAHAGAHTMGSDADGRAMRAGTRKGAASPQLRQQRQIALAAYSADALARLTPEERELPTMRTNFTLYGLPPPDCARMNFSAWQTTWRRGTGSCVGPLFDAIVTDPPYGLREPRKRIAEAPPSPSTTTKTAGEAPASPEPAQPPQLADYATSEVILDLVMFAAQRLTMGGHLSFWLPTTDSYTDDELPTHPSLQLVHNLPQRLSLKFVRRLITMKKVAPVPVPAPTREACAPRRNPDDLRTLMDATTVPGNKDYTSYRAKLQRRRDAARRYNAEKKQSKATAASEEENASGGAHQQDKRIRGGKAVSQEDIVANREKNMRIRREKQEASHAANLKRK